MTDLLTQYLAVGDLMGFVNACYTLVMGPYFYGVMMLIILVPLYLRTQSMSYVLVVLLIMSGMFYALTPIAAQGLVRLLMVLAVGGLFYYLFTRQG